jgi:ubiquitin conjugation factor E4 B
MKVPPRTTPIFHGVSNILTLALVASSCLLVSDVFYMQRFLHHTTFRDLDLYRARALSQLGYPYLFTAAAMSEGISDAERIRQKRIAKLSAAPSVGSTENGASTIDTPPSKPTPKTPLTDGTAESNPFSQLGLMKKEEPTRTSINVPQTTPAKRPAAETPPTSSKSAQVPRESPEQWENKTLSNLFRITLDPTRKSDPQGNALYPLEGLRSDLEQSGSPLLLSTGLLDQALVEAASNQSVKPLDYLLGSWKRIIRFTRSLKAGQDDSKTVVMKESKRLCMSYCVFAVTLPDMFGQEQTAVSPLLQHLLVDPENDRGICHDFINEAMSRFEEDDSIKSMFVEAVEQLSQQLADISIDGDYRSHVMALTHLVRYTPLVVALAESPKFLAPQAEARNIERNTLLGPFFKLSSIDPEVAVRYFGSQTNEATIRTAQNALRLSLSQHQSLLFDIADRFIKSSKESREKMLNWFAMVINSNHRRRAYQTDPKLVSSDGFMLNVTVCLDRLCDPFMDAAFSKVSRIEPDYFRRSPRVNIQEETKINADQKTSDDFYAQRAEGTSNFISEVFFLAVAAHQYGTGATIAKQKDVSRQQRHMERQMVTYEAERNRYAANPRALAVFDQRLGEVKQQVEKTRCTIIATEGILMDDVMQGRAMSLMRYVIVWLCRLVSNVDFPKQVMSMPLPEKQPDVFRCLPEYFVENIVDHFKYITGTMPHIFSSNQCDEIVMFCIAFLRSSEYIKNPGLKSGFTSILFHGVWPARNFQRGVLGDVLNSLSFAMNHLLHALMNFYIECEHTGAHAFYDKFNIRYEIFQVIKCIWGNIVYREQLAKESKYAHSLKLHTTQLTIP